MPEEKKSDEALKKLEKDNKELEDRIKSLSQIIELSAKQSQAKKTISPEGKAAGKIDENMEYLKKSIKSMKKSLKMIDPEKRADEMKMLLEKVEEGSKAMGKLSDIETKMQELEKKMGEKEKEEAEKTDTGNIFGGFGTTGGDLPENAPKNIKELLDYIEDFKGGIEERLLNLERGVEFITSKIGSDTLKKLDSLISAKDDIETVLIPKKVKEEVEKILSVFSFGIENLSNAIKELTSDIEASNEGMENVLNWMGATNDKIKTIENKISNETLSSLDKMKAIDERMKNFEITINEKIKTMEESINRKLTYVEEKLGDLQRDYRLVDVLKSELRGSKGKAKIPRKLAEDRFIQILEVVENLENEKNKDKRMKALKDLEKSYKKGLISRELYDEILKKLK